MRGRVLVDEEKDYSNWLAKQISFENMLAKNNLEKNLLIAENKNQDKIMTEEYTNNKIETKATDSSSGSYAPPIEKVPAKEAP